MQLHETIKQAANLRIDKFFSPVSKKMAGHYATTITYTLFVTLWQSQDRDRCWTKGNATTATLNKRMQKVRQDSLRGSCNVKKKQILSKHKTPGHFDKCNKHETTIWENMNAQQRSWVSYFISCSSCFSQLKMFTLRLKMLPFIFNIKTRNIKIHYLPVSKYMG